MKKAIAVMSFLIWAVGTLATSPAPVHGQNVLEAATLDYTKTWNPISYHSYPAHFVTRLVAEHLFLRKCYSREVGDIVFSDECMKTDGARYHNNALTFKPDNTACPGLVDEDVEFTIQEQIRHVRHNEYYVNDLRFEAGKINIGYPSDIPSGLAMDILTFPILRKPDSPDAMEFYKKSITTGHEDELNQVTMGRYEVSAISQFAVSLGLRENTGRKAAAGGMDEIKLTFFRYPKNLIQRLSDATRPDVVLGLRSQTTAHGDLYDVIDSPDLNSFTYVGFNYKVTDEEIRELFFNPEFRELFSQTLWSVKAVQDNTNLGNPNSQNLFIGQSFDADHVRKENIPRKNKLKQRVNNFIDDLGMEDIVEIEIMIAPKMKELFDDSDRESIITELNEFWSPGEAGVSFTMDESVGGSFKFDKKKKEGNFHMIMDSFHYTRNKLKYMAFIQEENKVLNYLGVDERVMPPTNIRLNNQAVLKNVTVTMCMSEKAQGVTNFGKLIAEHHPVTVIGYFPRKDLISTRIRRPPDPCGADAIPMPFYSLHEWSFNATP